MIIIQIVVALGIFNVWIVRYNKKTAYRAGTAKNIKEEFLTYGLPVWFMVCIGTLKISLAILLIIGIWIPLVTQPAAGILAILMLGALFMHKKVNDPLSKSLPALSIFFLLIVIMLLA